MTFEPTAQDCTDSTTGELCLGFIQGNGDDWLGRCRWEESEVLKDQIKVPHFCPKLKGTSSSTDNLKDGLEDEISGVTPKLGANHSPKKLIPCACGCGKYFEERGNKRFFNRHHKDNFTNRMRLGAIKKLVTVAKVGKAVIDEVLKQFGTDK